MALFTLVYTSEASAPLGDRELTEILTTARERNAGLDVTGTLLYHDGYFIQVLEGNRSVIETLYNRIKSDSRHRSVKIMWDGAIEQRQFEDWVMGFRNASGEDLSDLEGYTDWLHSPAEDWTPAQRKTMASALLDGFKRSAQRFSKDGL